MEANPLKLLYARLKGILLTARSNSHCSAEVLDNYNRIVAQLEPILGADLKEFTAPRSLVYYSHGKEHILKSERLLEKANELTSLLEMGYGINSDQVQIGSLYNAIKDQELKDRCADILSTAGNFDRVINQATQVLEDRIRKLSNGDRNTVGVNLVAAAMNADPANSKLAVSPHKDEQEGVFHILRGLAIGFRNPTHHHLSNAFTREQALKFCGFVDYLLEILGKATIKP